jgi:hydrogenase/urease accessory protein HupE
VIRLLLGVLFMVAASCAATAHELRPAYLELQETSQDVFNAVWKVPAIGDMRLRLVARLPDNCKPVGEVVKSIEGNAYLERWKAACDGGLTGRTIHIDGLKSTLTDALVRIGYGNGTAETVRVMSSAPEFTVTGEQGTRDVALAYLRLGVEHILTGFDHLTFVLALLLLQSEFRVVVRTITSFTVAHSITLSGAALGYFSLPQKPVEFLIALSIVLVAAELAKSQEGKQRLSERSPWLIAFPFGLLHGFGFAGALKEIGLPQADVPLALFTFNAGVEIGQLLFVVAVMAIWKLASSVTSIPVQQSKLAASYGNGCLAASWMMLRAASLF